MTTKTKKKQPKLTYELGGRNIFIKGVKYHRNGVGGEGFVLIHFVNEDGRDLLGIVTTIYDEDGNVDLEQTKPNIKVINPMDICDRYRGADYYGEILLKASEDDGFDKHSWLPN
jgi:hypothetical protein